MLNFTKKRKSSSYCQIATLSRIIFLLQCMKGKSESEVAQSCPTLCDPMVCSLPGSSVHGILEWVAIAFSQEIASLSHSIVFLYFFPLISEEGFLTSPCYSLELCIQMGIPPSGFSSRIPQKQTHWQTTYC